MIGFGMVFIILGIVLLCIGWNMEPRRGNVIGFSIVVMLGGIFIGIGGSPSSDAPNGSPFLVVLGFVLAIVGTILSIIFIVKKDVKKDVKEKRNIYKLPPEQLTKREKDGILRRGYQWYIHGEISQPEYDFILKKYGGQSTTFTDVVGLDVSFAAGKKIQADLEVERQRKHRENNIIFGSAIGGAMGGVPGSVVGAISGAQSTQKGMDEALNRQLQAEMELERAKRRSLL